jgi:hypothetical protein
MADKCTVTVKAGICGRTTVIHAEENDDMTVKITLESDCPMVSRTPLPESIVPWDEVGTPMDQTVVYKWASANLAHAACPVPCGIIKAIEVAGGLGLKKDVSIEIK